MTWVGIFGTLLVLMWISNGPTIAGAGIMLSGFLLFAFLFKR